MEKSVKSKVIIESYSNPANSALGLLQVAYNLLPLISDEYESINRWDAAENVAREFGINPLEVLVLDTPTAMLPKKRKELIENPESLFGANYPSFLEFSNTVTKDNGKALRVDPEVFTPALLADLGGPGNSDSSYRQIIEEKAQSDLRNKLPFLTTKGHFDPKLPENKHYEAVAKRTKDGILAAFKELVDNSFPDDIDEQYKERVALLAGLAAIEVLFVRKDSHRFLNVVAEGFEPQ